MCIFELAILVLLSCGQDKTQQAKPKKPRLVQVIAAENTRLVESMVATGEVIAVNNVTIKATVEGPISFCPWREGDFIEQAGQKLIQIDRPIYRQEVVAAEAALSVAKAKLADLKVGPRPEEIAQAEESVRHFEDCTSFAKADFERIRALVKSGSLPGEAVEKARVDYIKCETQLEAAKEQLAMLRAGPTVTEVAVAQAEVDEAAAKLSLARARFAECTLSAPFAGVITSVLVRPGDLVTPRTPLLEMLDTSSLLVRFAVPEIHVAKIHTNAKAEVQLDAYPGKTFHARIERVYPELVRNTRTCLAEARVLDSVQLLQGQFARISVELRTIENAVVVPDKAVLSTARGDTVVFCVNSNKAVMKNIQVGLEQEERVEITEGVQPGELVVFVGNENLKNGMQVQIEKMEPSEENKRATSGQSTSGQEKQTPVHESYERAKLEQMMFHDKFPIRLQAYDKSDLRFNTLDGLCRHLRDNIEKHPFAAYIATFDHYAHTSALNDGVIDPDIIGAKIVIFCFGKKFTDPKMLSVRPRSIGICETESKFVISFLEAPAPVATETMEEWVCHIGKTVPGVEDKQTAGDEQQ